MGNIRSFAGFQGKSCDIVIYGYGEFLLRLIGPEVLIYSQYILRLSVLGSQTVASACHEDIFEPAAFQRSNYVQVQWLPYGTRLLCSVQYSNAFYGIRQRAYQMFCRERSVKSHSYHADFLSLITEIIHDLFCCIAHGTHGDHHFRSIRRSIIVERSVVRTELLVHLFHAADYGIHCFFIDIVACFPVLEESLRLFCRTHAMRMIRVYHLVPESFYRIPVHHALEFVIIPYIYLLLFMTGPESVKEMQERHPAFYSCQMCHSCKVHYFLRTSGRKHREACLSARHDVRMIPEYGKCMRGNCSGCHMQYRRSLFRSYLIHIRYHKQQSL